MLLDVDWYVRFMQVMREIIIKGKFKVATLTHIWVEWLGHLEKPVLAEGDPRTHVRSPYGMPPKLKGII